MKKDTLLNKLNCPFKIAELSWNPKLFLNKIIRKSEPKAVNNIAVRGNAQRMKLYYIQNITSPRGRDTFVKRYAELIRNYKNYKIKNL